MWIHFQEKIVPASIQHIDSVTELNSGMCAVRLSCQETLGQQNDKYLAEVKTSGMKNVVILPYDAIQTENNQSFVWTILDRKAHKQFVTLGERNNKGILAQGIEEHQLIIRNGADALKENDPVKITYGN